MTLMILCLIFSHLIGISQGQLQVGFYGNKCPNVESIIGSGVVNEAAASNKHSSLSLCRTSFLFAVPGKWGLSYSNVETWKKMNGIQTNVIGGGGRARVWDGEDRIQAAHTIGTTACFFTIKGSPASPQSGGSRSISNLIFLQELKSTCPQNGDVNVRLSMDRGSGEAFDSQILQNIRSGFAVLQSDANLYRDETTRRVVDSYFGVLSPFWGHHLRSDFANAMVKMGRIGVHAGSQGTIERYLFKSFLIR
ncbi:hypothetical protein HAX54_021914 [Datura stramonium]|uniref:peroxidase n=1 Tax=Datura stramonium TaxID=4076 RepID=A0ABS8UTE8_DATST|nr:hypothetical protein [Datura stramonium]